MKLTKKRVKNAGFKNSDASEIWYTKYISKNLIMVIRFDKEYITIVKEVMDVCIEEDHTPLNGFDEETVKSLFKIYNNESLNFEDPIRYGAEKYLVEERDGNYAGRILTDEDWNDTLFTVNDVIKFANEYHNHILQGLNKPDILDNFPSVDIYDVSPKMFPVPSDCLHGKCIECNGTGRKTNGEICIHMISCPCKKCTPTY